MGLIISTLAPIFIIIALGVVLTRSGFITDGFLRGMNRFVYWVALPAMLFTSASEGGYHFGGAAWILLVMAVATLPTIAVAYAYVKLSRQGNHVAGTLMHVAMRGNLSYLGLPVIAYLAESLNDESLRVLGVLAFAPCMLFQNIVGIAALLSGRQRTWADSVRAMVKGIVSNPLLIAVAAGLLWAWSGGTLPRAIDRSLHSIGSLASPLALIAIGGALATVKFRGSWRPPLVGALLKVILVPALGWLACGALDMGFAERAVAMIFLASPTAASSYPMIVEMGGDEATASTAIFFSTIFSIFSLTVVLALL